MPMKPSQASSVPIAVIGAPIEAGTNLGGALMGPAALRTAGLVRTLEQLGHSVEDQGDLSIAGIHRTVLPPSPGPRNLAAITAWTAALSHAVHAILDAGSFPVVLGGDHSLSMGSIDGVSRHCAAQGRELFVLWLDAHADFNTPETSLSGNVHGMPLAALCGEPGLEAVLGGEPGRRVNPANVSLIGIRSLDDGERALLEARKIDVVDMRSIDEFGVVAPLRRILARVAAANGFLHVSLDVDFLDPTLAPGVGTTVPGGATFREAHLIMEMLHDSGLVASLDVVELNPFLDERGKSALVLVELVASLFGRRIIERPTQEASLA
ncbi:arginase [Beijerinckia sp. L45]|uniref:arginase n=1 Tax=Beijerinckia sp. L45 TaxID=1641855 RepID=UPI001FEDFE66|nr:arginase [Beijerinckia sp. L45]